MSDYSQKTPIKVLRTPKAQQRLGISRAAIYEKQNPRSKYYDPTFPQRISLGGRTVGFIESEIEIWLVARMAARTGTK